MFARRAGTVDLSMRVLPRATGKTRETWYWAKDLSGKPVQNVTYTSGSEVQDSWVKKKDLPLKMAKAGLSSPANVHVRNQEVRSQLFPHQEERLEKLHARIRQLCCEAIEALRANSFGYTR